MNEANTAWILVSTALVLLMTLPGLALFYAGLVGSKNTLSTLAQCFIIACIASIIWFICGYSLAFTGDGLYFGSLDKMFLSGVTLDSLSGDIPETLFVMFQMTFAIITPALIVGAFVERIKFSAVILITAIWLIFVYSPVTHWVWGGGWLAELGVMDFAGGLVVHTTAGISALVIAKALGARNGFPKSIKPPHSPVIAMIGAALLWVGWFGFNGGSQLAINDAANANAVAQVFLNTNASAAGGVIGALLIAKVLTGKADVTMAINGAIAGLVAITAAPDTPSGGLATIIGFIGGIIVYFSVVFLDTVLKIDDPVGAISAHGTVGIWGIMATPLSGAGAFGTQAVGAISIFLWAFITSAGTLLVLNAIVGLRPSEEEETTGLDASEIGVEAYPEFKD